MQSIQGTLKCKPTSSKPGELDISHNSMKQKPKIKKMRRQKNMFQMKEQNKLQKKTHRNGDK